MMFAKVSLCLVFVVFASVGQILSHPEKHGDSSEEQHHKEHKHDHGKSSEENHHKGHKHDHGKGHHDGGPYGAGGNMDMNFSPDSPFMKIKNLTEDIYNEIFVIASGDNYLSPEVPNHVHIDARAIVMLSQTLKNMISVYPIFYNVTTEYALKGAKLEDKQTIIDVISDLFAYMKSHYSGSTYLQFESIRNSCNDSFITRGKYFKSGFTPEERAKAYDTWLYEPFMRTASLNKMYYRAVWKNDKPPYKILRAMMSTAKYHEETAKLEKIYSAVLARTIEKVCPAHDPRKAAFIFYQNLMNSLSEDPRLLILLYNDQEMIPGMMLDKPF